VVEAYAATVRAAGIPMRAGFLGAAHARPVTAGSFGVGVLVCTFWGTILAVAVGKLSQRPRRTFALVGSALAAVSLVVPFGAGATASSTKLALAAAHVLVASVVTPVLVRAFPRGATSTDDDEQTAGLHCRPVFQMSNASERFEPFNVR
jgi:hypothetical protein